MRPDFHGQRALGSCLRLVGQEGADDFSRHTTPGAGPARMTLSPIAATLRR